MQNFFYKIRCALTRFMYGRNGVDALTWAIVIAEMALSLLATIINNRYFSLFSQYATLALMIYALVRIFSRNLDRCRAENARFLAWWGPKRNAARAAGARRADKAHKYVKCSCGTWCRVPRHVGKVELKCPKCGRTHTVKT